MKWSTLLWMPEKQQITGRVVDLTLDVLVVLDYHDHRRWIIRRDMLPKEKVHEIRLGDKVIAAYEDGKCELSIITPVNNGHTG